MTNDETNGLVSLDELHRAQCGWEEKRDADDAALRQKVASLRAAADRKIVKAARLRRKADELNEEAAALGKEAWSLKDFGHGASEPIPEESYVYYLRDHNGDADNADRAKFAQKALDAYTATKELGRYAEETPYTRVGDLIGDLLHLAQREYRPGEHGGDTEFDPLSLWERARSYYEEEVLEEVDAQPDQTV